MPVTNTTPARPVRTLLAIAAVTLLAFSGCASRDVKPDYPEVLKSWTRSVKIYDGLDPRLYLSATYKSAEFRYAYLDRYAGSYRLDDEYVSARRTMELDLSERYNEFFFTAYTPDESWNDFDRKDSVWRLYLVDDKGAKLSPVSIRKMDSTNPLLRQFFPYMDLWSQAYVARFPKYSESGAEPIPSKETAYIKLLVVGVLGEGELEWRLSGR